MSSNATSRDAFIAQFASVTGASHEEARRTLEQCNWNLQLAVNMFIDGGSRSMKTTSAAKSVLAPKHVAQARAQPSTSATSKEDVRAPIAPIKEVLVKDFSFASTGRFSNWRELLTAEGQVSPGSTSANQSTNTVFDHLFRPPIELIYTGNFEAAKQESIKKNKWLLVNIQVSREFACLTLNRDVWANQDVKKLIGEHFIFWQVEQNTIEGRKYVNFYHVDLFPHVAILDPRTGEKVLSWHKIDAKEFINDLNAFLTSNSSALGEIQSAKSTSVDRSLNSNFVHEQSEEAQLKAAIEASLLDAAKTTAPLSAEDSPAVNAGGKPSTGAWKQYLGPEGAGKMQLAIRFSDGKRHTVTFPAGTKLKALLLYITETFGLELNQYDLVQYPNKNLTAAGFNESATLEAVGVNARDTLYLQFK